MSKKKVPDILRDAADFFEDRSDEYDDAYKRHGKIMFEMFPYGIELRTPEDFYQYHILVMNIIKQTRIAVNLTAHRPPHKDSHLDTMVYSAMALEGES